MNKDKRWVPELQSLSGVAIIFVVLIHANSYYLLSVLNKSVYEEVYFAPRLLDNIIHGAVPMFIFIAGYKYILTDIDKSYKKYAISKINRVIKPFLIISLIFFIKDMVLNFEQIQIKTTIVSFLKIFIGYNIAYQLWYIPMYILITLTYPIIYKVFKDDINRIIFIVLIVTIQYALSWYIDLIGTHPFDFIYYYLFFEMGVIFCKYNIKDKLKKFNVILISIFIIIVLLVTLMPLTELCGPVKRFILWPMSVIAYYFLNLRIKDNRILQYLGKYSFYIFLLHEPIFCTKISYAFKVLGIYNSVIYVFIVGILTMGITIITYKIIEFTFIKKLLFKR